MCGIWGIITGGGIDRASFEKAGDALSHRGPDDKGVFINSGLKAALGHRRLSIIDLSESAHQPMSNEACPECGRRNSSLWVTYNGEIYNFREIRRTLTAAGHGFKSNSDTEVILHAYEEWGEKCLEKFQGMFAFAVWDEKRQRLFLARDRIGKKPVFYYYAGKTFAFASELQGLMSLNIPRDIDLSAIHLYLTYQYIPAPKSIYKNVFKLPPAHCLILDCRDNPPPPPFGKGGMGGLLVGTKNPYVLRIQKYWDMDFSKKTEVADEKRLSGEVFERLKESVRKRLISDVPLGAFLSGGIDSSIVTALMSGLMKEPVKTFSIGFEESAYNELPYAHQTAKLFKTDHKEFIVKFDALNVLPKLARHYGEPFADSSALPTYYLSKMTSEFVKVALSGDGGDENFAGYDRYYALKLMQWFRHMPEAVRTLCVRILSLGGESDIRSRKKRLRRFLQSSFCPSGQEYLHWMTAFTKDDMQEHYGDALREILRNEEPYDYLIRLFEQSAAGSTAEKAMDADIHSYLPFDLLVKVDIASMANSLEVRCPFLDYEFMEFAASIPVEYKLRGRMSKYILKKAFKGVIPEAVFSRQKAGFGVPISKWFRHELRDFLTETLLSRKSLQRGYFRPDAVRKLISEHTGGMFDNSAKLWALLMLELWHREFADV